MPLRKISCRGSDTSSVNHRGRLGFRLRFVRSCRSLIQSDLHLLLISENFVETFACERPFNVRTGQPKFSLV